MYHRKMGAFDRVHILPLQYAEKFAQGGYRVTGVDCSRRSVEYAAKSGFQVKGICSDVAGAPYREESPVIALLLEK